MVGSTSNSTNIHGFADDNSNPYRSMVVDAMRINHSYSGEGSCVDEKKIQIQLFFYIYKKSNETLYDECINNNKLLVIVQVFIINLDYDTSEAAYDNIIE